MVSLLVVAVLMAIAIPTFSGSNTTAEDRSAQENIRNALSSAEAIFASTNDYSSLTSASLHAADPALFPASAIGSGQMPLVGQIGWSDGGSAGSSWINFWTLSASGKCWGINQSSGTATAFGEDTAGCSSNLFNWVEIPPPAPPIYWQLNGFPTH